MFLPWAGPGGPSISNGFRVRMTGDSEMGGARWLEARSPDGDRKVSTGRAAD